MKYMLGKHDAWCGAMVLPHHALVKMSSCKPFINRTITEEVSCFREGNPQDWRGIQIFFVLCPGVFFYDEHTPYKSPCSNLALFRVHLPYLGDYVHFLGINYAQERSGKPCSCYLVHSHAFYKEWADISRKCVAIVNHKRVVYSVNNYTKNETHGWKTWRVVWCHGMASPCPW